MFNFLDLIYPVQLQNEFDQQGISSFSKPVLRQDQTKQKENVLANSEANLEAIWVGFNFEDKYVNELINRSKNLLEYQLCAQIGLELCEQIIRFWQILLNRNIFQNKSNEKLETSPELENETRIFELFQAIFDPKSKVLFTFVPADPVRKLQRGFHLPELICQSLIQNLNLKSHGKKLFQAQSVFHKPKSTHKQTGLNREQRLQNLKGKIELRKNIAINLSKYDSVIIIDDICTTGATFSECAKTLKSHFPFLKIYAVAVGSN
jgi:hypothetical protein